MIIYAYKVDGVIIGLAGNMQNPIDGIEWTEIDSEDPDVLQYMIDHNVIAPFGLTAPAVPGDS